MYLQVLRDITYPIKRWCHCVKVTHNFYLVTFQDSWAESPADVVFYWFPLFIIQSIVMNTEFESNFHKI